MSNKLIPLLFAASFMSSASSAYAQASLLIWPIHPKVENNIRATPLWLENTGTQAVLVQVRVFKWDQVDFDDKYAQQNMIIASPPTIKIEAGKKQMFRLTKTKDIEANKEESYRVIIDELPVSLDKSSEPEAAAGTGVKFQMRYSLPLFVYGKGLGSGETEETQKINEKNARAKPILSWSSQQIEGKDYLVVSNTGLINARISSFEILDANNKPEKFTVPFNYALPQGKVKFLMDAKLSHAVKSGKVVTAVLDSQSQKIDMTSNDIKK